MKKITVIQHFIFWPTLFLYAYLSVLASTNVKLSFFGLLLTAGIGTPVALYFDKLRRYFANVRYRQGRLQRTGDGGEDCWTVIVEKYWISFWKYPLWHFIRPFTAWEVTVDCGGYSPGSIRSGERALNFIAQHEKFCVKIGHNDIAPNPANVKFEQLVRKSTAAGLNTDIDLLLSYNNNNGYLTDQNRLTLIGLLILERDGLQFQP